jgi:GDPmannose 4,6-dehydratase
LLLSKGYEVHGLINGQRNSRLDEFTKEFPEAKLMNGDLTDFTSLLQVVDTVQPAEVYNLGAISFVGLSFKQPELTANVTGLGTLRLLEALRKIGAEKTTRFYQASSSEMFGKVRETPQNELTPFHPRSPYGVAKTFAHYTCVNYREAYNMHVSCGILFNHEGEYRGHEFVTRKITVGLSKIISGKIDCLYLGNIDAKRDWGYSEDYVEAMWLMMQKNKSDDYVVATNKTYSVKDFINEAVKHYNLKIFWKGKAKNQQAVNKANNKIIIKIDSKFYRPTEVNFLKGNANKAKKILKWKPKVDFKKLVEIMSKADIERNLSKS